MPTELKITQLRHFILVAKYKNFHTASKIACRSQPAISLSIMELERKLDKVLFSRNKISNKNHVSLTRTGEWLLPKAEKILQYHDSTIADMKSLRETEDSTLTIAAIPSIGRTCIPSAIKGFTQQYTKTNVEVYDCNSHLIIKMLKEREIDIGIAQIDHIQLDENNSYLPLFEDEIGVYFHKNHPLANKNHLSWEDLKPFSYIKNDSSKLLNNTDAQPIISAASISVFNMNSLIPMLESGFGVTTLPKSATPPHQKTLIFKPLENPKVTRKVALIKRQDTRKSIIEKNFQEHLVKCIKFK